MDSVLVVVLNWNGLDDTERCLDSLSKQTFSEFKVLLVDNGSVQPGTTERLDDLSKKYGKQLRIIKNPKNLGFAGGVNTGIRYAIKHGYSHVGLFNNDAVADSDWLRCLVESSEKQGSSLTTGLLLHEDGSTIDSTGDWYSKWGLPFPRSRGALRAAAPESGFVFGVSGGASLYKTKFFEEVGLFDETFFAYYEDADVSFRALIAGHTAYYDKNAVVYHKQGATSSTIPGFAVKQTMKNLPLLYIKNVPTSLLFSVGVRFWTAYLLILGKALLGRNFSAALVGYLQGVWLFWVYAIPARFGIQRSKKVTDKHIKDMMWPDLPPDQTGLRKLFGRDVQ
jgi:GT2 family glycosyltransferase